MIINTAIFIQGILFADYLVNSIGISVIVLPALSEHMLHTQTRKYVEKCSQKKENGRAYLIKSSTPYLNPCVHCDTSSDKNP